MAKARIGINGFGRIGRCLARQLCKHSSLDLIAINSRSAVNQDLLMFDTFYGKYDGTVTLEEKKKKRRKTLSSRKAFAC